MIFNSLTFLVFFAIVLALHNMPFSWHQKKINLMIASYLFYAAWNPPFVILLWISTVVDWWARMDGPRQARAHAPHVDADLGRREPRHARLFQIWRVPARQFRDDRRLPRIIYHPPGWDIVLPVGISFYTFATLSYTLDVYLRRSAPAAASSITRCS